MVGTGRVKRGRHLDGFTAKLIDALTRNVVVFVVCAGTINFAKRWIEIGFALIKLRGEMQDFIKEYRDDGLPCPNWKEDYP